MKLSILCFCLKQTLLTELLIDQVHTGSDDTGVAQTLTQVRHRYWIPSGRSAGRKVLRRCTVCNRWEGGPYRMPTIPPLLRKRIKESIPFSHSGIDYFGPLYVKAKPGTQKVWVFGYKSCSLGAAAGHVNGNIFTRTQKICCKTRKSMWNNFR